MPDSRHVEMLRGGVRAWNAWREEHPGIVPDLSFSNLKVRDLAGVNLKKANLRGVMMPGADLRKANLGKADLTGADLMESDLRGAVLTGTNLTRANLMGANLEGARLKGAILNEAILYRADLKDSECVCNCLWYGLLMDFADRLMDIEGSGTDSSFKDVSGSFAESSFVSPAVSRLDLELSDPVSTKAVYEILGALNRLYSEVSRQELVGPIIKIGLAGQERENGPA